ncbi:hypothetical protein TW83_09985 [Paracoccus sp. S4493]|uniref:hypothetical protein n=1 Tax=Paracoccus sp. S4493 TaxID=579490 RepID=UPI0005FA1DFF|nr:hypothetical protein [Paracoccus sp. S4493]KJZ31242.1 hypothetical protein TW83_09985 [Paracoccus sp. S4493]
MDLREDISLLLANGHPDAGYYSAKRVQIEARLVRRRTRRALADEAQILSLAIGANISAENGRELDKTLKDMRNG